MKTNQEHVKELLEDRLSDVFDLPVAGVASAAAEALMNAGLLATDETPAEPAAGAVLRDKADGTVWLRMNRSWFRTGYAVEYTWAEALSHGADPAKPLVDK